MNQEEAPDAVQVLTGWRLWHAIQISQSLPYEGLPIGHFSVYRLSGMRSTADDWPPMRAASARCVGAASSHGESPAEGCRCGFYAIRSLPQFVASFAPLAPGTVVGEVSLWGKVILCERGYRAKFAYPKRLIVIGSAEDERIQTMAGELSASYQVETQIGERQKLLREGGLW